MCRLGDFASLDLLQRVGAFARGVEGVHEMHVVYARLNHLSILEKTVPQNSRMDIPGLGSAMLY